MATYFVIADIHSFYKEMIDALDKAGFDINNKNHILISLGDLFDRGPDSRKCLEFINNIPEGRKILIRGNHEDLLEDCFKRNRLVSYDYTNGTDKTIFQLADNNNIEEALSICKEDKDLRKYLDSCIDYFETDKYIFVHGWIPSKRNDSVRYHMKNIQRSFDINWRIGDWNQGRWDCGFDAWYQGIVVSNKTIVCGHWHTSYGHSKYHNLGNEWEYEWVRIWNIMYKDSKIKNTAIFDIFKDTGIIAIDGCTAYSGHVNCLKLGKQPSLTKLKGVTYNG